MEEAERLERDDKRNFKVRNLYMVCYTVVLVRWLNKSHSVQLPDGNDQKSGVSNENKRVWIKWDMKFRYWNNIEFVPLSPVSKFGAVGFGVELVQGVLVAVAESWSWDSNRGRFPVGWVGGRGKLETLWPQREPVHAGLMDCPQCETSCPITLTAWELVRAGFTSPGHTEHRSHISTLQKQS